MSSESSKVASAVGTKSASMSDPDQMVRVQKYAPLEDDRLTCKRCYKPLWEHTKPDLNCIPWRDRIAKL